MGKKKGFTLGRFQPFHNEHASLIEDIKSDCDEVYVGILKTKKSEYNPFSDEERVDMISNYDDDLNVFSYERKDLVGMGIGIRKKVPFGSKYYSGDRKEIAGMSVLGFIPKYHKRKEGYSATKVRNLMFDGDDGWKDMVPQSTIDTVEPILNDRLEEIKELEKKFKLSKKYDI